jgi:hypothetical protein
VTVSFGGGANLPGAYLLLEVLTQWGLRLTTSTLASFLLFKLADNTLEREVVNVLVAQYKENPGRTI